MTKTKTFVLAMWALSCAAAWGGTDSPVVRVDYDMKKLWAANYLDEPELSGRRLYVQRCALCHDQLTAIASQESATAQPFGPPLSRDTIQRLSEAGARTVIAMGSEHMPGFRYALTPLQVGQILAFVGTVSPSSTVAVSPPMPLLEIGPRSADSISLPTDSKAVTAATSSNPNLWGTVRSSDGKALIGASVSARASGSTVTISVYTDERGDYFFPRLDAGLYALWAQGVGYETSRMQISVNQSRRTEFRLSRLIDYSQQLRGSDWFAILPARTAEERQMKELIRVNCVECHALSVTLRQPFDERGWLAILNAMERAGYDGSPGPALDKSDSGSESGDVGRLVIRRHKAALAKYLASVRGPSFSPSILKAQPAPVGEAARVVVTEYDVPVGFTGDFNWSNGEDRSQGAASGNRGAMSAVHDVRVDDDGNPWITSTATNDPHRSLARIDAKTGQVTDFKVPARSGAAEWTHGITKDADGNIWADGEGLLLRMDPRTTVLDEFRAPEGLGTGPRMTSDVDRNGFVWSATRYGAVRFDPKSKRWNLYGNVTLGDGFSYGMVVDGAGRGWWTQFEADRVEMADPATGHVTEFRMAFDEGRANVGTPEDKEFYESIGALEWGGMNTVPGSQAPRRLGADKTGNAIWVPNYHGLNIARIDTVTGAIRYVPMPIPATPYFVTVDQHHSVWMNALSDDALFKYDPASEKWTIFSLPSLGCDSRHMSLDEKSGDAWIACSRSIRVGRFHFRSAEELHEAREATLKSSQELMQ